MNDQLTKLKETTPDLFIDVGKSDVIMLYNRTCGQTTVLVFKDHRYIGRYITTGWGHNKTINALDQAFQMLDAMPRKWQKELDITQYRVGGNYHKIPVKGVRRWSQ